MPDIPLPHPVPWITARDGHASSLFTLLSGCLDYRGYVEEPDGAVTGLLYRQFADFTRDRYQLRSDVITDLDPDRITRELDQGRLVMASVHKEIRRPEHDPPATGGHLVLITGHNGHQISFRNPSGHTPQAGRATLPMSTFDRFAAHRRLVRFALPTSATESSTTMIFACSAAPDGR